MLRRLLKDRKGSLPTIFAIALPPAIMIAGAGIDLARAMKAKQEMMRAVESAALASASLSNTRDFKTVIEEYVAANLADNQDLLVAPTISIKSKNTLNSREVEITASSEVSSTFLKFAGYDNIPISASVSAFESNQDIEISMVLDISSSMKGAKLTNLKLAATDFVDTVLEDDRSDYTSVNLVPFGGSVNIGDALFDRFAVPSGSATVDPSEAAYSIGGALRSGDFLFTDSETCIEHPSSDFDDDKVIPSKKRPQVPHVWKWNNFNPWCPPDESAAIFNSNKASVLRNRINEFVLSDGTGMDIGALWGYKALSNKWAGVLGGDFPSRPRPNDGDTIKIMVVMTDGNITAQFRPKDWSTYTTKSNNQQTAIGKGKTNDATTKDTAIGQFNQICALARADKFVVYTIGFNIKKDSLADKLLTACASDPSKYFFVEGLDIETAFDSIAASINALRITG